MSFYMSVEQEEIDNHYVDKELGTILKIAYVPVVSS
jgi:hypothetical protein